MTKISVKNIKNTFNPNDETVILKWANCDSENLDKSF